ncbi:MAG: prenyltransferase [Calditrichaeota bacterium]|nr:prenyltransferase [Calditrichota bacterium]RQW03052.1 MAG: prenyltransferase [Calditrichota bacterium]
MSDKPKEPGLLQVIRASFLSSIIAPIWAGTLLAVSISGNFNLLPFLIVTLMGLALHTATNVYNDIYDTKQGTDRVNRHRNEFSGGSGLIIQNPHILPKMYRIARISLLIALLCTVALMFFVRQELWIHLWLLYLLSAFFSKYYTAEPVKLASRGLGEVSVWFAFGPMAILVAAVSQNVGLHPLVVLAMPATGISTLSILLVGQLIDRPADREGGKWGVAVRLGSRFTAYLYLLVQLLLVADILLLALNIGRSGGWILLCLLPYVLLFPKTVGLLMKNHDHPAKLKQAAKLNVQIHMLFSILLVLGLLVMVVL